MKYFLKTNFKNFPDEIINKIYSYVDVLSEIKEIKEIWYKRLVNCDYKYYSPLWYVKSNDKPNKDLLIFHQIYLKNEERQLEILIKNKAFHLIKNIHCKNLNIEV